MVTSNHTCSVTNSARMNYFQFTDVDVDFVREQLSSLKVKKSSGMKDIHTRFLKTGADVLAAPLTYILNLSLHTATMPSSWKSAAVTLLHKNGSMSDPNNFRPICVLPVVMKIFERAVHQHIYHQRSSKNVHSHSFNLDLDLVILQVPAS